MREITPMDERPRHLQGVRLLAEALKLFGSVAGGPAGRLLRKAALPDGSPLFGCGEVGGKAVWVCLPLADVIRTLKALAPADQCPACRGAGCGDCHAAGYLTDGTAPLLPGYTELQYGPALDVWGWVRQHTHPVPEPAADDDEDDDGGEQRSLLDLLRGED